MLVGNYLMYNYTITILWINRYFYCNMTKNKKIKLGLLFLLSAAMLGVLTLYSEGKERLTQENLHSYQKNLDLVIQDLINERRHASMVIALTLAENPEIKSMLCESCEQPSKNLNIKRLVKRFAKYTDFKDLWVQVIDKNGVSLLRSWSSIKGDFVAKKRKDIAQILVNPKITTSLSVGMFSLTFKSIVPIENDSGEFSGMVEIISQFGLLADRLKAEKGVESIILLDKSFRAQLTKPKTGMFVNQQYVVNENASPNYLQLLENFGDIELEKNDLYQVVDVPNEGKRILGKHHVTDESGSHLGVWYTVTEMNGVSYYEIDRLLTQAIYALLVVAILFVALFSLYYSKRKAERQRIYYRQIINSASEIILVANKTTIVEANQHFFEFYSSFDSLKDFLNNYKGVCDTFVQEDGFLAMDIDGTHWLEYVSQNPEKEHKVKIMKEDEPYYFRVKVSLMQGMDSELYSVLLLDITEQERSKKELELLSVTDALTGVGNRLLFNRSLTQELQRSHRYGSALSLIIFDIDFFKQINDEFGHDIGDNVLIEMVKQIKQELRETDIFCRFGGEEFVIILPQTGMQEAANTAERLRAKIENLNEVFPKKLTVSFGVTQVTKWDNPETLLKRADNALYKAKDQGRNQVVQA